MEISIISTTKLQPGVYKVKYKVNGARAKYGIFSQPNVEIALGIEPAESEILQSILEFEKGLV